MAPTISWSLLPQELIELQLGQIDLLLAMYPEEITIDESSHILVERLRDEASSPDALIVEPKNTPKAPLISMLLRIPILRVPGDDRSLELDLAIPFTYEGILQPDEPPRVKVRVLQPSWLSRAATGHLTDDLPEDEDLLGTIEHIKEAASQELQNMSTRSAEASSAITQVSLVRVWFYFPSISTRSKRDDFIIHAPSYSLTGFLYAGKPGLLCVEGGSQAIDDYMKFIKTESWGDIPAHHKKVSERYRENKNVERVFPDMTETTDMVGERRGQRANRGDMKAMEEWLTERGLGDAFAKVLM
jgi:hypothetical protein